MPQQEECGHIHVEGRPRELKRSQTSSRKLGRPQSKVRHRCNEIINTNDEYVSC